MGNLKKKSKLSNYQEACMNMNMQWTHYVILSWLQIEDGEIHATISKQNGMVHFHDNPEKYDNPAVLRHVEQQVRAFTDILMTIFSKKKERKHFKACISCHQNVFFFLVILMGKKKNHNLWKITLSWIFSAKYWWWCPPKPVQDRAFTISQGYAGNISKVNMVHSNWTSFSSSEDSCQFSD